MYPTPVRPKHPALTMLAVVTAVSLCIGACSASGSGGSGQSLKAGSTITLGTDPTYAPFEFYQGKTLVGFDIDTANALATQLNMKLKFVVLGAGGEDPALKAGKFDMLVNHGVSPARAQVDAFTKPFVAQNFTTIVAATSKLGNLTLADLSHMKIGVLAGGVELDFTQKALPHANVTQYDTAQDEIRDLLLGRTDVVVEGSLNAGYTVQHLFPGQIKIGGGLLAPKSDESLLADAVQKSNTKLLSLLNTAMAAIAANGVLDRIIKKWFGDIDYAP